VVIYTYLVPAMPIFLLIAIFVVYYARKRTYAKRQNSQHPAVEMPKHSEIAFGVAATLLAILPLRSVFVPASYPSPTRLDLWLGLGAVILVAFSIIWVVAAETAAQAEPTGSSSEVDSDGAKGKMDGRPVDQSNPNLEDTSGHHAEGGAIPSGT
jgi:hypothetical protein